jgi:hypothetical protein
MNQQKILIATIAGGVTLLAGGFIIYELIFGNADFVMNSQLEGIKREAFLFPAIILMELLYGFLLAVILNWKKANNFGSGLMAGAFVGLLIGVTIGLNLFSTTHILQVGGIIFLGVTYAIRYGFAGGVIGLIYRPKSVPDKAIV